MIFKYGTRSLGRLETCHLNLIIVAHKAIEICHLDITVICGARGREAQNEAYAVGTSTKQWPNSMHNAGDGHANPLSLAIDLAPWIQGSVHWDDEGSFYELAGAVKAAGKIEGIELRGGTDWDRDGLTEDQTFMDLGHFELVRP